MHNFKKILAICLSLVMLSSCFSNGTTGSSDNGETKKESVDLTGIELVVSKTSCLTGETINCSFNPIPSNANMANGKSYDKDCIEYWIDGNQCSTRKATYSYVPSDHGKHEIVAYYCTHSGSCNHVGDFESEKIVIDVDLPESEKVMFKYKVLDDGTASIYAGALLNDVENVIIPAQVDSYEVSSISENGFKGLKKMKTLRFSSDLKSNFSIGSYAFKDCTSLKRVHLVWQIKKINKAAFANNDPDLRIFIEDSVLSSNFYFNYSGSTSNWNSGAYPYYLNMKDFADDDSYLYGLNNSNTYEIIQYYGREVDLVIPSNFNNENITHIEHNAYSNDSFIKTVVFPEHLLYIGTSAFSRCSQIKEIRFPQELEEIDSSAFSGCTSLHYVQIPLSVNSIGNSAFTNNYADLRIYCAINSRPADYYFNYSGASDNWNAGCAYTYYSAYDYLIDGNFVYAVHSNNTLGITEYNGRESNLVISEKVNNMDVSSIHTETFLNKNFLQVVTLPSTIVAIDSSAFKGCISLKTIKLPSGLNSLGDSTFSGCSSLLSLIIPLSVKDIGASCFYGCSNLELFVESGTRPAGFYFNYSGASNNWNSGVKMTYYGVGNGWFLDADGNPYHL